MDATIRVTRDNSFVGIAIPYRIKIDGQEVAKISAGGEIVLTAPIYPFTLDFVQVGSSLNFHPIHQSIYVDPRYSQTGLMQCHLRTKANWGGILTSGIFFPVGKLEVDFRY